MFKDFQDLDSRLQIYQYHNNNPEDQGQNDPARSRITEGGQESKEDLTKK